MSLTQAQVEHFAQQGYVVIPGLFSPAEAERLRDHYMALRATGDKPGDFAGTGGRANEPTRRYPRMIQMHNWDPASATAAADPRILAGVKQLIHDEPVLNQTMIYYKPPGGRGQGLHQDQQYICIQPLIGVWIALDDSDRANGHMIVVPESPRLGLLPVERANEDESFTDGQTQLPAGTKTVGLDMKAGDGLFFDGKCIHGSYPNTTADRFRRSFICHYVGAHAVKFTPPQGTNMAHLAGTQTPL